MSINNTAVDWAPMVLKSFVLGCYNKLKTWVQYVKNNSLASMAWFLDLNRQTGTRLLLWVDIIRQTILIHPHTEWNWRLTLDKRFPVNTSCSSTVIWSHSTPAHEAHCAGKRRSRGLNRQTSSRIKSNATVYPSHYLPSPYQATS